MNWDEYFMNIAKDVALKSIDPSTQVGCVIIDKDNKIIATGYNGFPTGCDGKYMTNEKPMRYLLSIHAEMRAVLNARQSILGCRAYVTHASCENCLKHFIEAGIVEVVYDKLFTNGKFIDEERIEAIIRLMKSSKIIHRNMQGLSFIEDVEKNK